jgi:hypothetical protein
MRKTQDSFILLGVAFFNRQKSFIIIGLCPLKYTKNWGGEIKQEGGESSSKIFDPNF